MIPISVGISLVGYPISRHFLLPPPWSILLHLVVVMVFEYYVWRGDDVKRLKELERRKGEMQNALDDMDRAS